MLKLAVTGSLSSCKSAVCHLLKDLGAYVISADAIVHRLIFEDIGLKKEIIQLLGEQVVVSGEIDRKKAAEKVFEDQKLLLQLEEMIHPLVKREIERLYRLAKEEAEKKLFVVEVPLLFESSIDYGFDKVLSVTADKKSCIARFIESKGSDERDYFRREKRLIPAAEKVKRGDFMIENNGTLQELKQKVISLYRSLVSK